MPGEPPAIFGDALRRLAGAATYLYKEGARVWYDTQPTVTKLAEDRAEQLKRDPDKVYAEIDERIREDARRAGDFARVHAFARSAADVPDDQDARLSSAADQPLPSVSSRRETAENYARGYSQRSATLGSTAAARRAGR